MWDFFKYLLDRVHFTELVMFFIFLLISFWLVPVEITEYFRAKTPVLFKSWFHLGDVFNLVFAAVLYLIYKPTFAWLKKIYQERQQRNLLESLDDEEMDVVYAIMKNHFQPISLGSDPVIMSLLSKKVLMFQDNIMGENYYLLTPEFKTCFLSEFRKSCERKD